MVVAKSKTKKTARKTAAKKKTKRTARLKTTRIRYSCSAEVCKATPKSVRIGPARSTVYMTATNTAARVRFTTSPFATKVFNIPAGTQVSATVTATAGSFPYALSCTSCPSPAAPPEMIVP